MSNFFSRISRAASTRSVTFEVVAMYSSPDFGRLPNWIFFLSLSVAQSARAAL